MKKLMLLAAVTVIIGNTASTASSWDENLFFAEAGVGVLVGAGTGYLVYSLFDKPTRHDDLSNALVFGTIGFAAGVPLGVIIFGDSVGARPENPGVTFIAPLGASFGTAIASMFGLFQISYEAGIYGTAILTPLVTAVIYNVVKKPRAEETEIDTRISVSPYSTLLAERDGKLIPTYGVMVGL